MRIVIAGASGFLGSHLAPHLEGAGHEVNRLVRRAPTAAAESQWDPYADQVDADLIGTAEVVVNLAGAPTAGNPHSKSWANELRRSRVTTTVLLARTIAEAPEPPAYLAGNGISFYGDRGAEVLTESEGSRGDAMLTKVTREWQAATKPASDAGARVCILRTAPVLDRESAPLKQLLLPFRLGPRRPAGQRPTVLPGDLVARLGRPRWPSSPRPTSVSGPVNLCCPATPTNAEFTAALADSVGTPGLARGPLGHPSPRGWRAGARTPRLDQRPSRGVAGRWLRIRRPGRPRRARRGPFVLIPDHSRPDHPGHPPLPCSVHQGDPMLGSRQRAASRPALRGLPPPNRTGGRRRRAPAGLARRRRPAPATTCVSIPSTRSPRRR